MDQEGDESGEDDEDDSDDESDTKKGGKGPKPVAGGPSAAGGADKEQECKQQWSKSEKPNSIKNW